MSRTLPARALLFALQLVCAVREEHLPHLGSEEGRTGRRHVQGTCLLHVMQLWPTGDAAKPEVLGRCML